MAKKILRNCSHLVIPLFLGILFLPVWACNRSEPQPQEGSNGATSEIINPSNNAVQNTKDGSTLFEETLGEGEEKATKSSQHVFCEVSIKSLKLNIPF